jgi:Ferritin-like domain
MSDYCGTAAETRKSGRLLSPSSETIDWSNTVFEEKFITDAITRSAETALDRRKLLTMAGLAGVGAAAALATTGTSAFAAGSGPAVMADAPSDASILNFALNLEYLEAEFYLRAVTGEGLDDKYTTGTGTRGGVSGGRKVKFKSKRIGAYAREIARDEREHVVFLRTALGAAAVSRPSISLNASFTAAAQAAGLIKKGQKFDPYASDLNFLFAAFIFEDVGVTAYKGAAQFIANKTYLDAAAGILSVEAYHAGVIRTTLHDLGEKDHAVWSGVQAISNARDSLDGSSNDDQGIRNSGRPNLVPTDGNGLAYGRTTGQVLNVVYLNPGAVSSGGFFPAGLNGDIVTSTAS